MENKLDNNSAQSQKLSAEIKKTWGKLTEEEIGFQASNPSKFYDAVKTKYSINKDEAEKTVKKLEADSVSGNKDADTASSTAAKAANDLSATKPAPKAANA